MCLENADVHDYVEVRRISLENHLIKDVAKANFLRSGLHELLKAGARLLNQSQSLGRGCEQSLRIRALSEPPNLFIRVYHFSRPGVLRSTRLTITQDFGRRCEPLLLQLKPKSR